MCIKVPLNVTVHIYMNSMTKSCFEGTQYPYFQGQRKCIVGLDSSSHTIVSKKSLSETKVKIANQ